MIGEAIKKLVQRQNLSYDEAVACMDEIMSGNTDPIQTSAFLTALSMKERRLKRLRPVRWECGLIARSWKMLWMC